MPHITLNVYSGKKSEVLEEMAQKVRDSLVGEPWGMKPSDISVSVAEYAADDFQNEVHKKLENETLYISSEYIK